MCRYRRGAAEIPAGVSVTGLTLDPWELDDEARREADA